MFFSFLGLRTLLGLLVRSGRGPDVKDIELLVLRPSGHVRRDTNNGALHRRATSSAPRRCRTQTRLLASATMVPERCAGGRATLREVVLCGVFAAAASVSIPSSSVGSIRSNIFA